jgi:TonB-linked SusC/RagA family outer membrane protein
MKRYLQTALIIILGFLFFLHFDAGIYANSIAYGKESTLQEIVVTGVITSATDNLTLPGVNILEKGTLNGTVSDKNGKYSIKVSSPEAMLVFSYIGFLQEEVTVNGRSVIDITLIEKIEELGEVVVVGYGKTRKTDLTSPVSSVKESEIRNTGATNLTQALQGKAAGVYVSQGGGAPGEQVNIYVRGVGSVNNTTPLYVVDGITLSESASTTSSYGDQAAWKGSGIGSFDISDIESVEILKDASSTAIYGARGANGVILITTKRGKKGKPAFNFSANYGIASPMNLPKLVNANEYSDLIVESYLNAGLLGVKGSPYYPIANNPDTIVRSTNWMKELYQSATRQNYVLDFSAGGEFSKQYASFSYTNEEGTYVSTGYKKFGMTFNTENKVSKWLEIGNSLNLSFGERDPQEWAINAMMEVNPFMMVYDTLPDSPYTYGILPKKYLFNVQNVYGTEKIFSRTDKSWNGIGSLYLQVTPFKGLTWKTTGGGNFNYYKSIKYTAAYDLGVYKEDIDHLNTNTGDGASYTANSVLTYQKEYLKNNLSVMAGWEIQAITEGNNYTLTGANTSYQVIYNYTDPTTRDVGGNKNEPVRWLSYFGRLNYNYDSKYYLTANLRWDGSSKFPPGNRIGFFPSFSAAWRISKEAFMANIANIIDLKLRGGYGSSGNVGNNNFPYLQFYGSGPLYYSFDQVKLLTGIHPISFPNNSLIWEKVNSTDVGFDLSILSGKIEVTGDYYIKKTTGMIIAQPLAYHVGLGNNANTDKNAGSLDNKGFEISVVYRKNINKVSLSVGGNASYNKVILNTNIGPNGSLGQFNNVAGEPLSSFYGYKTDGLWGVNDTSNIINYLITNGKLDKASNYKTSKFTAPGDLKYKDVSGDGLVDSKDFVNLGNPWPKMVYGLFMNASLDSKYGSFDFSTYFTGVYGNKIYNLQKRYYTTLYSDFTTTTAALDRWTPTNTDTDIPRMTLSDPNGNMSTSSSYFVEDGSYFRCKNLVIGYTLPGSLTSKLSISKFRIYMNITNLFTVTKYSGMDPEVGGAGSNKSGPNKTDDVGSNISKGMDNGSYPQSRIMTFGVQMGF